jgi:S-adenosylmethionine uptake transporter
MSARRASPAIAFAVACLGIAIFSLMDAAMKHLSIAIGAYNAMLWRTAIGLVLSGALVLVQRPPRPARAVLVLHVWRSASAGLSILLFFWGLVRVPLAPGIAISFIAPLIGLMLAGPMLKERVPPRAVIASLVAFGGVLIVAAGQLGGTPGPGALSGMIAILVAALFYAVNLVLARRQSQVASPAEVVLAFNIVAGAIYLLGAPWLAAPPALHHLPLLALAALTSVVSIMLLAWAYARAEAHYLMPAEYTAFVWAALLGWVVFREPVTPATVVGAAIIIAACLWAARQPVRQSHVDPEAGA